MAAATIRNRLRHLMSVEGRPEVEWFSPHGMRRACATHNNERGVDLVDPPRRVWRVLLLGRMGPWLQGRRDGGIRRN